MATRSQVLFYEEGYDRPIVFYQHWDGYELPHIVADALDRADKAGRLTDTPYLGRIIFSEMLRHSNHNNEDWNTALSDPLSYGISFSKTDWIEWTVEVHSKYNDKPTIVVNEDAYSFDNFITHYLKENGAWNWKNKVEEPANV